MVSLIITIIAVALVAALVLATMYYGGNAGADANSKAKVAKVAAEGTQISGAFELYRVQEKGLPTGTPDAIKRTLESAKYVTAFPQGDWELRHHFAVRTDVTDKECIGLNRKLGIDFVPSCSDTQYDMRTICCSDGN